MMKHRVVKFTKPDECVREQQTQTGETMSYDDGDGDFIRSNNNDAKSPVEGSVDDSPECSVTEPVADRYPKRDRQTPAYLNDYDTSMTTMDCCYKICAFPQNYREAIESPECEYWKDAMKEEMNSMKENNTFTLTTLPEGRKLAGVDGCLL